MTNATTDRQEQIRSAVRRGNEFTVEKIKAVAGAAGSVRFPAPRLGETRLDVPKLRQDALAYARRLPAPVDVVESAFGLADRLMAGRRRLAGEVRKAASGVLRPAAEKPAEESAAPAETTAAL